MARCKYVNVVAILTQAEAFFADVVLRTDRVSGADHWKQGRYPS